MSAKQNLLYNQSGGVTAVINASAAAVISAAQADPRVGRVLAARNGILGVFEERLVDVSELDAEALQRLSRLPGGAFGSCRYDLPPLDGHESLYERLFAVFDAHDVGYFLCNGGNGSMDTVLQLSRAARRLGYPLTCVGVPKTVDNDLIDTDCSPGYGSAARYLATSMLEAGLDLASMTSNTGRVFVMEVMGRNAGWLAAATALAANWPDAPPHLILLPEVPFDEARFLARVEECVQRLGYCTVTVAEGVRLADGSLLAEQSHDAAGHVQLGGAGEWIARLITHRLGYKHHWAVPDYLQRAAGHLVSPTDRAQAAALGAAAVACALDGRDGVMPGIRRLADAPYRWDVVDVPLGPVANGERKLPEAFIAEDGFGVSEAFLRYARPLVGGEQEPDAVLSGVPAYTPFVWQEMAPRLPPFSLRG